MEDINDPSQSKATLQNIADVEGFEIVVLDDNRAGLNSEMTKKKAIDKQKRSVKNQSNAASKDKSEPSPGKKTKKTKKTPEKQKKKKRKKQNKNTEEEDKTIEKNKQTKIQQELKQHRENKKKQQQEEIKVMISNNITLKLYDGTVVPIQEVSNFNRIVSNAAKSYTLYNQFFDELEQILDETKEKNRLSKNLSCIYKYANKDKMDSVQEQTELNSEYDETKLEKVAISVIEFIKNRNFGGVTIVENDTNTESPVSKHNQGKASSLGYESLNCSISIGKNKKNEIWFKFATGPTFNTYDAHDLYTDDPNPKSNGMPLMNYLPANSDWTLIQQTLFSSLPYTADTVGDEDDDPVISSLLIADINNKKENQKEAMSERVFSKCAQINANDANKLVKMFFVSILIIFVPFNVLTQILT